MFSPGKDCHITISHPEVDAGAPFGFILQTDSKELGPAVAVQREKDAEGRVNVRVFFTIVLGENLINPDGSRHTSSRSACQQKLVQFLSKTGGLSLCGSFGILPNVGASGHAATESHYGSLSFVSCQLINAGNFCEPADGEAFEKSRWDGAVEWGRAYWR